jgi:hypothetical protein
MLYLKSLRKNRPSTNQPWKQPVKDWIGQSYEKRFGRKIGTPGTNNNPQAGQE